MRCRSRRFRSSGGGEAHPAAFHHRSRGWPGEVSWRVGPHAGGERRPDRHDAPAPVSRGRGAQVEFEVVFPRPQGIACGSSFSATAWSTPSNSTSRWHNRSTDEFPDFLFRRSLDAAGDLGPHNRVIAHPWGIFPGTAACRVKSSWVSAWRAALHSPQRVQARTYESGSFLHGISHLHEAHGRRRAAPSRAESPTKPAARCRA